MSRLGSREIFTIVVRLVVGSLLIVAGILKFHDGSLVTASFVAGYRLLPSSVVTIIALALPFVEIFLGLYLFLGFFTRCVAVAVALQFIIFAGAVSSLIIRGISADCGCFGSSMRTPPSWFHVFIDVVLAALCGFVAYVPVSNFSLDALFWNKKIERQQFIPDVQ